MQTIDEFDEDNIKVYKTNHSTSKYLAFKFTISSGTLSWTDGSEV